MPPDISALPLAETLGDLIQTLEKALGHVLESKAIR